MPAIQPKMTAHHVLLEESPISLLEQHRNIHLIRNFNSDQPFIKTQTTKNN